MAIKNVLLLTIILLLVAIIFRSTCIAGTWKDDFSDPTLWGWGGSLNNGDFIIRVVDGCLNFKGLKGNSGYRTKNCFLGEIKDYLLEVEWKFEKIDLEFGIWGIEYNAYDRERKNGIEYWKSKGNMFFGFYFGYSPAGFNVVITNRPPGAEQEKKISRSYFEPEEGRWYKFKLAVTGNQYKFFIDNEVLAEIEDNTVTAGWVGFRFDGMIDIYIDNFRVTGQSVPNGGPGTKTSRYMIGLPTTWGKLKFD